MYEVPVSRLKPGKMVRCARCGGEWQPDVETHQTEATPEFGQEPEKEDSAPEPEAVSHEPSAMERLAAYPPASPRPRTLVGAWVATAVVIAGALGALFIWRHEFMSAWPPSERILGSAKHVQEKSDQLPRSDQQPAKTELNSAKPEQKPTKPGQIPGKAGE
jgi:hypothetical protein